jgi:hypothetical protein
MLGISLLDYMEEGDGTRTKKGVGWKRPLEMAGKRR